MLVIRDTEHRIDKNIEQEDREDRPCPRTALFAPLVCQTIYLQSIERLKIRFIDVLWETLHEFALKDT